MLRAVERVLNLKSGYLRLQLGTLKVAAVPGALVSMFFCKIQEGGTLEALSVCDFEYLGTLYH